MYSNREIINGCKSYNGTFQKVLYQKYAPTMLSVCIRYTQNHDDAKDILQEGFLKIFNKIKSYNDNGSFEGWMKRIFINTALDYFRKDRKSKLLTLDYHEELSVYDNSDSEDFDEAFSENYSYAELMEAINELKDEYKLVFNLYIVEDYSHKEIAALLTIKEETSRSRLLRAKNKVKETLLRKRGISMVNTL